MGISLGALLVRAGERVNFVTRNAEWIKTLNENGAVVEGSVSFAVAARAMLPEEMGDCYDVIFLCTRQNDNDATAQFLQDKLTPNGVLVSVQNGYPEPRLKQFFPKNDVYGCTLSWSARRNGGEGWVEITSESGFFFGLACPEGGMWTEALYELLSPLGEVTVGSLAEIRFAKLVTNSSLSSLSVVTGLAFREIVKRFPKQTLALMRETIAVARAAGCSRLPLNGKDLMKVFGGNALIARMALPIAMKRYRNTKSGMLETIAMGRRTDIDFVSGAVVREGECLGVATPMQRAVVALVKDIENGLAEIAPESVRLLEGY